MVPDTIEALATCLYEHAPVLALTGAGCSTESGIPDYRNRAGEWKHRQPVMYQDFVHDHHIRQRYWARSMNGWQRVEAARPNAAHNSLALLESAGYIHSLITQNVDGLHQKAGSREVIDLHGRLQTVRCLECDAATSRSRMQARLLESNAGFLQRLTAIAPDGDAMLEERDYSPFMVPACHDCGGVLKPDVVFFGEAIPRRRLDASLKALDRAGCLLIAGSSLMVFSGYRYCREAARRRIPIVAVNQGVTRADELYTLKLEMDCGPALTALTQVLSGSGPIQQYRN